MLAGMLKLVHIDDALMAVDKPEGLLAVPGRGPAGLVNLTAQVQAEYGDARVVHRLDMATSGLMLFARGAAVQRQLSVLFAERQVHKRYVALVLGDVQGNAGTIDARLTADWPNRPRQVVAAEGGKTALTHWRVLARLGHATRLELTPVTGRSHQLRVHLQFIGHPICGDALYVPGPQPGGRLLLHASDLSLQHPRDGHSLVLHCPAPF